MFQMNAMFYVPNECNVQNYTHICLGKILYFAEILLEKIFKAQKYS